MSEEPLIGEPSPRELDEKIRDLKALLASSERRLSELAVEEKSILEEEAKLTKELKELLAKGNRPRAADHALELKGVRDRLAAHRKKVETTRDSHEKALAIARAYDKARESAARKRPDRAPPQDPPPTGRASPEARESHERTPRPSPLWGEGERILTSVADSAREIAGAALAWVKEIAFNEPEAEIQPGTGQEAFERGDYKRTIEECNRALARDPGDTVALCNRGAAHSSLGETAAAIKDYDAALRCDPDHALTWSNRADAHLTLGNVTQAESDASRAIELDPLHPLAWYNRGRARASLGMWEAACADFQEVVDRRPDHALAHAHMAVTEHALGDSKAAARRAEIALRIDPTLAFAHRVRAQALFALGELNPALESANEAIRLEPDRKDALYLRARIHFERGDPARARDDLDRGLELESSKAEGLVTRAQVRAEVGDFEGALSDLDRALDEGHEPGSLHAARGEVLSRSGEHEGALAALDEAVALLPKSGAVRELRGRARYASGDFGGAFDDAEEALRMGEATALEVRGFARWELLDAEGARADLEAVFARSPDNPGVSELLGRVRAFFGDKRGARQLLERSVNLDPSRRDPLLWLVALGASTDRLAPVIEAGGWDSILAKLVSETIDLETAIETARMAESDAERSEHLCEVHALAGLLAERRGERERALRHYQRCYETRVERFPEHAWARARLALSLERDPVSDRERLARLEASGVLSSAERAEAERQLAKKQGHREG